MEGRGGAVVQPGAASGIGGRERLAVAALRGLEERDWQVGPLALDNDDGGDGKHGGHPHDCDGEGQSQGRFCHLPSVPTQSNFFYGP